MRQACVAESVWTGLQSIIMTIITIKVWPTVYFSLSSYEKKRLFSYSFISDACLVCHFTSAVFSLPRCLEMFLPLRYIKCFSMCLIPRQTVCVEKNATLGGTCLNVGCIPSKVINRKWTVALWLSVWLEASHSHRKPVEISVFLCTCCTFHLLVFNFSVMN